MVKLLVLVALVGLAAITVSAAVDSEETTSLLSSRKGNGKGYGGGYGGRGKKHGKGKKCLKKKPTHGGYGTYEREYEAEERDDTYDSYRNEEDRSASYGSGGDSSYTPPKKPTPPTKPSKSEPKNCCPCKYRFLQLRGKKQNPTMCCDPSVQFAGAFFKPNKDIPTISGGVCSNGQWRTFPAPCKKSHGYGGYRNNEYEGYGAELLGGYRHSNRQKRVWCTPLSCDCCHTADFSYKQKTYYGGYLLDDVELEDTKAASKQKKLHYRTIDASCEEVSACCVDRKWFLHTPRTGFMSVKQGLQSVLLNCRRLSKCCPCKKDRHVPDER